MNRQKYLERHRRYNRSEKGRARSRDWYRKDNGIPLDAPVMTPSEIGKKGARRRADLKVEKCPITLRLLHKNDRKAQAMIALMLDPNNYEGEKIVARDMLRERRWGTKWQRATRATTCPQVETSRQCFSVTSGLLGAAGN